MRSVSPASVSCIRPAMARVCPSRSSTVVCALRVFRPGTGLPPETRVTAMVKSMLLTSGATVSRMTSPSRI